MVPISIVSVSTPMKKRTRVRRVLKWLIAGLLASLIVLFSISIRTSLFCRSLSGRCYVSNGILWIDLYYGTENDVAMWQTDGGRYPNLLKGPNWGAVSIPPKYQRLSWRGKHRTDNISRTNFLTRFLTDEDNRMVGKVTIESFQLPLWWFVAGFGMLTVWLFWLDRPRRRAGTCPYCSYDLRGNISGRCPECGRPVLEFESVQ
jgi:hypothetical protein